MKHDFTIPVHFAKWSVEKNADGGEYVFVEGYATTEKLDSQGEKIAKAAVEKAAPAWKGNIREMHQPSAVGKAVEIEVDDKGMWVRSKIVDPAACTKVKEGIYNDYSLGGKRIAKEGDTITELKIVEVSLVDVGANDECGFTIAKMADDGAVVDVQKFEASPEVQKLEAKFDGAVEMLGKALTAVLEKKDSDKPYGDVTYADPGYQEDGKHRYPIDTEEHVRAAWSYINQEKNQSAYSSSELSSIKGKIKSAAKKFGIDIKDDAEKLAQPDVKKDLGVIGWLAGMIGDLDHIAARLAMEREMEGDDSGLAEQIAEIRDELGEALVDLVTEETKEIEAGTDWQSPGAGTPGDTY
jgi:Caudovirus prohead serine protease